MAFTDDGKINSGDPRPSLPPRRAVGSYDGGMRQNSELSPVGKKEEMWKRRWARARELLAAKGIILKAWKTGSDVINDSVDLIERFKSAKNR